MSRDLVQCDIINQANKEKYGNMNLNYVFLNI